METLALLLQVLSFVAWACWLFFTCYFTVKSNLYACTYISAFVLCGFSFGYSVSGQVLLLRYVWWKLRQSHL